MGPAGIPQRTRPSPPPNFLPPPPTAVPHPSSPPSPASIFFTCSTSTNTPPPPRFRRRSNDGNFKYGLYRRFTYPMMGKRHVPLRRSGPSGLCVATCLFGEEGLGGESAIRPLTRHNTLSSHPPPCPVPQSLSVPQQAASSSITNECQVPLRTTTPPPHSPKPSHSIPHSHAKPRVCWNRPIVK